MSQVIRSTPRETSRHSGSVPKKDAMPERGSSAFKEMLKAMRDKDREPVRGIFRFYELPGGTLEFVFNKYAQDPIEKFCLTDGHLCTIPLGVAKHLNKNGFYPVHSHRQEEDGKSSIQVGKKVRRFGFQSLDFIDESDFGDQGNVIIAPDSFAN